MIDTSVTTTLVQISPNSETSLSPSQDNVTVLASAPTLTTLSVSVDEVVIAGSTDSTTDVSADVITMSIQPSGIDQVVVYADSPSVTNVSVDDQQNVTIDTTVLPPSQIIVPGEQPVEITILEQSAVVNTIDDAPVEISIAPDQPVEITIEQSTTNVISTVAAQGIPGAQGPQGIPGPPGGTQTYNTATSVATHTVVSASGSGGVQPASCMDLTSLGTVVGITTSDNNPGDITAPLMTGIIEDINWTFTPDGRVFLGDNGQLVQTLPPAALFQQVVGIALSATKVLINIMPPILLA